jgi:putative SOS response-associated peptidase YedK
VCERYVIPGQAEIEREFRVAHPWWKFQPSFSVAPGRAVPVLRSYEGEAEGVMLPWGMVPEWAEGDATKARAMSLRAEQVERTPIAQGAWRQQRRCILPASGFYVWQLTPQRYRQPYFVRPLNRAVFGIAALWDRTVHEDEDDVLESCAVLTVATNSVLGIASETAVPAILARDDYERWLTASSAEAFAMLGSSSRQSLLASAISPRINALKYDDAQLIEPVDQEERRSA